MVPSRRLTTFYRLVVGTLFSGISVAAIGGKADDALLKQDKEAVAVWLGRAEQYAAALPEDQLNDVFPTLAGAMLEAGEEEPIDRLLPLIKDPKKRAEHAIFVCIALAGMKKCDAAIRRAQSLPAERRTSQSGEEICSWRVSAIYQVAWHQMLIYDFAAAEKTIALIDDPQVVSNAHHHLAKFEAKAGLYADAEKNLAKYNPITEEDEEAKAETKELIAKYKAENRKDPPPKPSSSMINIESLRRMSTIFADTSRKINSLAEAQKAEKAADKAKKAVDRATAWREIAWAYYDMRSEDEQNPKRCRRAIENSVKNAEQIPSGLGHAYMKTVAFASAADLYQELGETETVRQLVRKADAVSLDGELLGGLSSFTTTPLLIGVLVRVDDIDGALAIAEKLQKTADGKSRAASLTNPDFAWLYWAGFCAFQGEISAVEHQLEKTTNPRIKAILCAGVADGLLVSKQRAAGK